MKRRRFLFTAFVSAPFSATLLAACAPHTTTNTPSSLGQTLVMATSADYPPYQFIQTANGRADIVGFDVDIAKAITAALGYGLEINTMNFRGLIPTLQAGGADFVMAGMAPNEERRQNADFSNIYFAARNAIVSKQGHNLITPTDLSGRRVGVQLGTIQGDIARGLESTPVVSFNQIDQMIQALKAGQIDAVILEGTVALHYVQANPDLEFNAVEAQGEAEAGSAIAFPQGSPLTEAFNRVLQEMQASGEIERLAIQWFGDQGAALVGGFPQ